MDAESMDASSPTDPPADRSGADPEFLVVGHLNKVHGTKGELFAWPLTDHPESHFAPGVVLSVGDESGERPDLILPGLTVQSARPFRKGYLLRVAGVDSRDQAELYQGRYLLRPMDQIDPLEPDEYFYHQLLGCEVFTVEGRALGRVEEVYELRPAHLLEIEGPEGTLHIPLSKAMVRSVDITARRIEVDPPEGLLEQRGDEESP